VTEAHCILFDTSFQLLLNEPGCIKRSTVILIPDTIGQDKEGPVKEGSGIMAKPAQRRNPCEIRLAATIFFGYTLAQESRPKLPTQ
jgi:hypothetical protein